MVAPLLDTSRLAIPRSSGLLQPLSVREMPGIPRPLQPHPPAPAHCLASMRPSPLLETISAHSTAGRAIPCRDAAKGTRWQPAPGRPPGCEAQGHGCVLTAFLSQPQVWQPHNYTATAKEMLARHASRETTDAEHERSREHTHWLPVMWNESWGQEVTI